MYGEGDGMCGGSIKGGMGDGFGRPPQLILEQAGSF